MISYRLVVYGYKKDGQKCPIGYELFGDRSEAALQGQAVCDILSSLYGIYACYGYDVEELDIVTVRKEV